MRGLARGQVLARKRSPKGGDSDDAGGVPRLHVINRIADKDGLMWSAVEALEGNAHGLGIGLVTLADVAAHDDVEVRAEAHVVEPFLCQPTCLAGNNGQRMAGRAQAIDDLDDAIVAADEP